MPEKEGWRFFWARRRRAADGARTEAGTALGKEGAVPDFVEVAKAERGRQSRSESGLGPGEAVPESLGEQEDLREAHSQGGHVQRSAGSQAQAGYHGHGEHHRQDFLDGGFQRVAVEQLRQTHIEFQLPGGDFMFPAPGMVLRHFQGRVASGRLVHSRTAVGRPSRPRTS